PRGGGGDRLRPERAGAVPRGLGGRGDAVFAAVRCAVAARRDDVLRVACEAAQTRAHAATPVRAVTARRAVSPVGAMRGSWAIRAVRCNGIFSSRRRRGTGGKPPSNGRNTRRKGRVRPSGHSCVLAAPGF